MTTELEEATQLYGRLKPGAQQAYTQYILTRTRYSLQDEMVPLIQNDLPPLWTPDPAANTYFNTILALGSQVSASRQTLINNLMTSLRTAGFIGGTTPLLSRLGLIATENELAGKVDLIDPSKQLVPVGNPAFTADQGYIGGVGKWIDTGLDPALAPVVHFGAASLSTRATGADTVLIGNVQLSGAFGIYPWTTGTASIVSDNSNVPFGGAIAVPNASVKGIYHSNRTGPTVRLTSVNGVQVLASAQPTTPPTPGKSLLLGAWRNTDGVSVYANSSDNICAWFAGTVALSPAQTLSFAQILNTYMTAIGQALF